MTMNVQQMNVFTFDSHAEWKLHTHLEQPNEPVEQINNQGPVTEDSFLCVIWALTVSLIQLLSTMQSCEPPQRYMYVTCFVSYKASHNFKALFLTHTVTTAYEI